MCEVKHESILLFELGSDPDDFPSGVVNTHKNCSAFGVEKGDDSFEENPFGLVVLDGKVVGFVLDVDAFWGKCLAQFEVTFAVDAARLWLLVHGRCLK